MFSTGDNSSVHNIGSQEGKIYLTFNYLIKILERNWEIKKN